jgi:D-alanine-D-alanine ligase
LKKLRILALVQESLIPPEEPHTPSEVKAAPWRMEYDVVHTLRAIGHDVRCLGIGGNLGPIRDAINDFKPEIAFNLLEGFDNIATWDQNVVAYLELIKMPYTGCNSRGLLLGRDKVITKKLLTYHRIAVPDFTLIPRGKKIKRPKRLRFPLFVKSATLDASIGISQASVVEDEDKLRDRVAFIHESTGTDALVETYIEGRELSVGVLGNTRLQALAVWELSFEKMPEESRHIATERLKWSLTYQKKHGIASAAAKDLPEATLTHIQELGKRVYRSLLLSGYGRIDLRLEESGRVYVIEANPNPQIARGEDFADSAENVGISYGSLLERIISLGFKWDPTWLG